MPIKKNCKVCKKEFFIKKGRKNTAKFCSYKCKSIFMRGKPTWNKGKKLPQISGNKHWHWKGGKFRHKGGYVFILQPNHPCCNSFGYVFEHRLVMEKCLGRYLNPKERVHHINHIKDDNRLENLMYFSNESEHQKSHHKKGIWINTGKTHFKKGRIPWNKNIHWHKRIRGEATK